MCGIVGFIDKTGDEQAPVGRIILAMLDAMRRRGPDSAGVALYRDGHGHDLVLRIKLDGLGPAAEARRQIADMVGTRFSLRESSTTGDYMRLVLDSRAGSGGIERYVESIARGIEVVSMGRALEIVKQVGSPGDLEAAYGISEYRGTHGIGHVRLATESAVDLSHSQPFWVHGHPDVAIAHNGHITNYHKLRRCYEQQGVRFYTENDSEVIGVYLAQRLSQGMTLEQALRASVTDLDGSFSYLAATADALGFAKDRFAFKPLLLAETEACVAVATEEIAICAAFDGAHSDGAYKVREAQAKEVRVWQRSAVAEKPLGR